MRRNIAGFTLIELLVVIAIIAILAAIIFPIFTSAKASATTAKCLSSIKQVGTAMQLYSDANDSRLPPYSIGLGNQRLLWSYFIKPYLRADRIHRCSALPPRENKTNQYDAMRTGRLFGYGVPYPHLFSPESETGARPTKLAAIPRMSKTLLMADSYTTNYDLQTRSWVEEGYPVIYCRACGNFNYAGVMPDGNIAGRHGGRSDSQPYGKSILLFCDLHAKAVTKESAIRKYNSVAASGHSDMWAHFDNIQR